MDMPRKFSVSVAEDEQSSKAKISFRSIPGRIVDRFEQSFLKNLAHHKFLSSGEAIYHELAPMSSVSQILSGVVKLSKTLSDGRQQIVGLRFPTEYIGSPFKEVAPYHAETVTPVHLCSYDRMKFENGLKEHRAFEHWLFQNTLEELDAAREWMLLLGRKYAVEKIASFLLMLAERLPLSQEDGASTKCLSFTLPLTRSEIADFLGLTIETVSRNFSDLKAKKIIGLGPHRGVSILDFDRLSALAEQAFARKPVH